MGFNSDPGTRLLTHALLRGSQIFPGLELCDNPPDYTPLGFADIWKGEYRAKPVCIKVARYQRLDDLREVERVRRLFYSIGCVLNSLSYQRHRRFVNETKLNSHPNVLPVIQVSEGLFPVCIMSPWMPNGNITQYTQMNPDVDRLRLVRAYRLGD